jgi:hypothetical protein
VADDIDESNKAEDGDEEDKVDAEYDEEEAEEVNVDATSASASVSEDDPNARLHGNWNCPASSPRSPHAPSGCPVSASMTTTRW